jgi:hypothetical protein
MNGSQIVPRLSKLNRYSDYTSLEHHKVDVEFGAQSGCRPGRSVARSHAEGPAGQVGPAYEVRLLQGGSPS